MQSDMIKPTFVPKFRGVVDSDVAVPIGTDTAEYVDAINECSFQNHMKTLPRYESEY